MNLHSLWLFTRLAAHTTDSGSC